MIHPCCNFDWLNHLEKELSLGRLNRNKTKKQKNGKPRLARCNLSPHTAAGLSLGWLNDTLLHVERWFLGWNGRTVVTEWPAIECSMCEQKEGGRNGDKFNV
jgi:hypothetical protein